MTFIDGLACAVAYCLMLYAMTIYFERHRTWGDIGRSIKKILKRG